MTYSIAGLDPAPFAPLFAAASLSPARGVRLFAANGTGFPCRVSLQDAREGEPLLLVNHVSHDVAGPFRASHAIYVREGASRAAPVRDRVPAMIDRRTIGLRGFDGAGMMRAPSLAMPGEADRAIRELLSNIDIACIHAHIAAHGCFLAAIERCDD